MPFPLAEEDHSKIWLLRFIIDVKGNQVAASSSCHADLGRFMFAAKLHASRPPPHAMTILETLFQEEALEQSQTKWRSEDSHALR